MVCAVMKNCDVVTAHKFRGTTISVGITLHDGIKFMTLCFEDPITGCQHIQSRQATMPIVIERLARALMISDGLV